MRIEKYTNSARELWNSFLNNSKNGLFMFNRNYMEYHKDRFEDNSLLFFDDKDELVSILPLSKKENTLISHGGLTFGGFITNDKMKQHHMNDLFFSVTDYMKKNGYSNLIYKAIPHIYHKQPAEEDLYSLFCNNAKVEKIEAATVINLQNKIKMPKGRKAQVTRARREGVVFGESIDFDSFIELENEVLKEHHNAKAVHTGAELKLLHENFPEQIKLFTGSLNGKIIAGCVLFIYDEVVHTQYLAANDLAREIGALDFVVSNLIEIYGQTKTWFDFGKSTEGNGSILNEGLISQKEGFGGRTFVYQTYNLSV